jgi:hypothetical protein
MIIFLFCCLILFVGNCFCPAVPTLVTIGNEKLYTCFESNLSNASELCHRTALEYVSACGASICGGLFGDYCQTAQHGFYCFYLRHKTLNGDVLLSLSILSRKTNQLSASPSFFVLSSSTSPFEQYPLGATNGSMMFARQFVRYATNDSMWSSHASLHFSGQANQASKFLAEIDSDCNVTRISSNQLEISVSRPQRYNSNNVGTSCTIFNFQKLVSISSSSSLRSMTAMVNHSVIQTSTTMYSFASTTLTPTTTHPLNSSSINDNALSQVLIGLIIIAVVALVFTATAFIAAKFGKPSTQAPFNRYSSSNYIRVLDDENSQQ